jgi:hypothetical protein
VVPFDLGDGTLGEAGTLREVGLGKSVDLPQVLDPCPDVDQYGFLNPPFNNLSKFYEHGKTLSTEK